MTMLLDGGPDLRRTAPGHPPPDSFARHGGWVFPLVVWTGLAVVLAAAAILSYQALMALARQVDIPAAWLLPVAVDAGAAVSCAVWLGGGTSGRAARYAMQTTYALVGATVAGNAAQQGMTAAHVAAPWWAAVAVGAIPPAVVIRTVHLVVLLTRRSEALPEQRHLPSAGAEPLPTPTPVPEAPPEVQPEALPATSEALPKPAVRRTTRERVLALRAEHPELSSEEIGRRVGVSGRRVRQLSGT